ncbi:MAG: efflux RND transporter periplasmic adaptor subunit [Sphingomonadales bacterium]|nr:efflux RND transporter periplasmic adaptor subunit [Sphingomonadales bacterium]
MWNILKKILMTVAVLVAGVGVVKLIQVSAPKPETVQEEPRAVSMFVENARQENLIRSVVAQGEVTPKTEIDLVSQVGGRIVSVSNNFVAGGQFEKGFALLKIDDADYKLALIAAEASLAGAKTNVKLKEASADVARRNWDDRIVGKASELALKIPQLNEARAMLKSAEADVELRRLQLDRTNISVPFNGLVRLKSADLGQYVTPGMSLGRVLSTEVAEVRLALTDMQYAALGVPLAYFETDGDGPAVTLSASIAGSAHKWSGRIVRSEGAIDPTTRVIYVVAQVDDPYGAGSDQGYPLPYGLYVQADIVGATSAMATVVPRDALRSGNKVYVIDDNDEMDIRIVEVGYGDDERVEIKSGINVGERVVVSTVRAAQQGLKVAAIPRVQGDKLVQNAKK